MDQTVKFTALNSSELLQRIKTEANPALPKDTFVEQQDLYQVILEDALTGFWDWNIQSGSEYFSPTFKAMLGYKIDEFENQPESWQNVMHPDDLPFVLENLEAHLKSHGATPFRNEVRYYHRTGRTIWALCTGRVIEWLPNGQPLRMIGCQIDITHQKTVEQELRVSESRFKGAFEHSAIGMALVSLDGQWLRVNKRLSDLLGYSEEQLLKKTFQEITHPDDLDLDLRYVKGMLAGEIETYKMDKRYFHKSGRTIWVTLSVSLVRNTQGDALYFVSQIEDITQRKLDEEELKKLNQKLKRQNRQLSDFAQITSHNLRAPVSNLSSLLMMHAKLEDPTEKESLFQKFSTVIAHLTDTLGDLTESLKITENPKRERKQVKFSQALKKVTDILAAEIIESEAEITGDFAAAPAIFYNRPYLDSILFNLVSNSLKYRSPGRKPLIELKSWKDKGEVKLSIADNGLGINMDRQGHKLFGLHKTFHRNNDSKGVGLFMTKAQIESQGGEISARSEEGNWTVFTVVFNKRTDLQD